MVLTIFIFTPPYLNLSLDTISTVTTDGCHRDLYKGFTVSNALITQPLCGITRPEREIGAVCELRGGMRGCWGQLTREDNKALFSN